jgi:hypothetical protein
MPVDLWEIMEVIFHYCHVTYQLSLIPLHRTALTVISMLLHIFHVKVYFALKRRRSCIGEGCGRRSFLYGNRCSVRKVTYISVLH